MTPISSAAHAILGVAGLLELLTLVGYVTLVLQLRVFRVGPPRN